MTLVRAWCNILQLMLKTVKDYLNDHYIVYKNIQILRSIPVPNHDVAQVSPLPLRSHLHRSLNVAMTDTFF